MRDFERPSGRLRGLSFHARLVYSVFLVFTLAALGITAWLADEMVGADLSSVHSYYAGEESTEAQPSPVGGPSLDLPEDAVIRTPPMPRRKLLEVTHFHLFSMPIYLLILSHLYMLSRASGRAKSVWILLATIGVAAHVAAPWIAATGTSLGRAFYAASGTLLAVPFLVMCIGPLMEMWSKPPPKRDDPKAA
jgi:hypothetical protein